MDRQNRMMQKYKTLLESIVVEGFDQIVQDVNLDEYAAMKEEVRFYKEKMEEASQALDVKTKCVVCLEQERGAVFELCNHAVCCNECAEKVVVCPVCRKHTNGIFLRCIL